MQALHGGDPETFRTEFRNHPSLWNAVTASVVGDEPSYMNLHYYSMMTYDLKLDDQEYLVRFRVVPLQPAVLPSGKKVFSRVVSPELSGEHVEKFLQSGPFFDVKDAERPTDLYETDYAERLKGSISKALHYQMEYQMAPPENVLRNSSIPWDRKTYPFQPFGRVRVTLLHKDDNSTTFDMTRMPQNVSLAPAPSVLDPRIIGEVRTFVYPRVQAIRNLYRRLC
jgi:hypothetical protein